MVGLFVMLRQAGTDADDRPESGMIRALFCNISETILRRIASATAADCYTQVTWLEWPNRKEGAPVSPTLAPRHELEAAPSTTYNDSNNASCPVAFGRERKKYGQLTSLAR